MKTFITMLFAVALVLGSSFSYAKEPIIDIPNETIIENLAFAHVICKDKIEEKAKYDYRWTYDNGSETIFNSFKPKGTKTMIIYIGNAVMFQNVFGAYKKIGYYCYYNPINIDATFVMLEE